jgi:hypothetical protein
MRASSIHDASGTIAAGLPANGLSANASICQSFNCIACLARNGLPQFISRDAGRA